MVGGGLGGEKCVALLRVPILYKDSRPLGRNYPCGASTGHVRGCGGHLHTSTAGWRVTLSLVCVSEFNLGDTDLAGIRLGLELLSADT